MTLVLRPRVREVLRRHLEGVYPDEGCGILVGRDLGLLRDVHAARPTPNVAAVRRRRFRIAPEDLLEAEWEARAFGLDILGFYHSHPDGRPAPSATDRAAAWSHYTYVIAAVRRGALEALEAWRAPEAGLDLQAEVVLARAPRAPLAAAADSP